MTRVRTWTRVRLELGELELDSSIFKWTRTRLESQSQKTRTRLESFNGWTRSNTASERLRRLLCCITHLLSSIGYTHSCKSFAVVLPKN